MKKILAVSGGIDSVVLLDLFKDDQDVVVAHVNHGTRPSADTDQAFVSDLAKKYNKKFYSINLNLGEGVSELNARNKRYKYLREIAKKENGVIYTAHHFDDLVETVSINLLRGTGWKGLVPFQADNVERPLINQQLLPENKRRESPYSKLDLIEYAAKNSLSYRQDPTNNEDNYLRNRVREKSRQISCDCKKKIYDLFLRQQQLKTEIEFLTADLFGVQRTFPRQLFGELDSTTSLTLIRILSESRGCPLTRPQAQDFIEAIKTYLPGKKFNLPRNKFVKFTKTSFIFMD